jgi:hypothetical protein
MTISFSRVESYGHLRAVPDPQPTNPAPAAGGFAADLASASGAVSSPSTEVSAEVREAARAAARLHEMGRELRFDRGDDGRIKVELRDTGGNVLRSVPPTEIFDFAEGRVTS